MPGAPFSPDQVLEVLNEAADAVARSLHSLIEWGPVEPGSARHHSDLVADRAALEVLGRAGVGILSEESGLHHADRPVVVALDPLDGSTNADRGIPWFATSLCALDAEGPMAAVVLDLARGARFDALRGHGARLDGAPIRPSGCTRLAEALVGLSGHPGAMLGWQQYRALGAIALDLCAVACGVLDAYIDCSSSAHGPWDYLGGALVCTEAGALVVDAQDRPLTVIDHGVRRTPVAAATPALLAEAVLARRPR